jgi:hypothetical protein
MKEDTDLFKPRVYHSSPHGRTMVQKVQQDRIHQTVPTTRPTLLILTLIRAPEIILILQSNHTITSMIMLIMLILSIKLLLRLSKNYSRLADLFSVCPKRKKFNNPEERRQFIEDYRRKFKTELCKNWELRGQCKFGDKCCFAHGKHELKSKTFSHMKYKTKPCKQYFQTGYCPYGLRCQYLHREALQPNILFCEKNTELPNYDVLYEKLHQINTMSNSNASLVEVLSVMPNRTRLAVFASFNL